MRNTQFKNIDEYIVDFPDETRSMLEELRLSIQEAAPKAEEVISYGMPAFKQNGMLVYFAGYKKHIGFYPTASGIASFKKELIPYKSSKGAVQFPLDKPLPLGLIKKIVKFRVKENLQKAKLKTAK
jgi:uncharacterized protein YdhG (YjbR/CyaY superfamily)